MTPIQCDKDELFRSVRMNDGKEIEVSKLLELFYYASGINYSQFLGDTKDSSFFKFNENGLDYTISPNQVYSNRQGKNIQTSNIFEADDNEQMLRTLSGYTNSDISLEQCNSIMDSKIKNSFMNVRDFNISDLQEQITTTPNSLDLIQKKELAKHYSIDDISYQLGLPELLNSGNNQDAMKAHALLMAYLNNQSYNYNYNEKDYQFITLSDGATKSLSDVQELFFIQNNIDYSRDENYNLSFKVGNENYYWKYNYSSLLNQNASSQNLLAHQLLMNSNTNTITGVKSIEDLEAEKIKSIIPLSTRIPTSKEEGQEMSENLHSLMEDIENLPHGYQINYQKDIQNFYKNVAQNESAEKYEDYINMKEEKQAFYAKDDDELLQEYKQKVSDVAKNLSSGCKSDDEKILRALEYVRLSGRYENLIKSHDNFRVGSRLSQSGISYALTGEGVCASQAEYTRDILNEMGFESTVETCHVDDNPNIIRSNTANHLITKVKSNGKSIALDPTHYDGTKESLTTPSTFSVANATSEAQSIRFEMKNQSKSDDEISSALSKVYEASSIKTAMSAQLNQKNLLDNRLQTPFGTKSLKELHFSTLKTTDESILSARKKAGDIIISELGIDSISEQLNLKGAENDTTLHSLILGYLEDNLQKLETENMSNISSRIVNVGDNSLEFNDALELFYMANNIDYSIEKDHVLSTNIDGQKATIETETAYKNEQSIEAERDLLFEDSDGFGICLNPHIQNSVDYIHDKNISHNKFTDRYKIDIENVKYDSSIHSQKARSNDIER